MMNSSTQTDIERCKRRTVQTQTLTPDSEQRLENCEKMIFNLAGEMNKILQSVEAISSMMVELNDQNNPISKKASNSWGKRDTTTEEVHIVENDIEMDTSQDTIQFSADDTYANSVTIQTNNSHHLVPVDVNDKVIIGTNTAFPKHVYDVVDWSNYKKATMKLLTTLFTNRTLATHNLTGIGNSPKKGILRKLNDIKIRDIVQEVHVRCNVHENLVRQTIAKGIKLHHSKRNKMFNASNQNEKEDISNEENEIGIVSNPYVEIPVNSSVNKEYLNSATLTLNQKPTENEPSSSQPVIQNQLFYVLPLTNNKPIENEVTIGESTKISRVKFDELKSLEGKKALSFLIQTVFTQDTLRTHSLSGSLIFKMLPKTSVDDIIMYAKKRLKITPSETKEIISNLCRNVRYRDKKKSI